MPAGGPILAIEISNPTATPIDAAADVGPGVALASRDAEGAIDVLGIEMLTAKRRHDDDLLPAIDRLCVRTGVEPGQLSAVAVSQGPGGFTGLRVAVSAASAIALGLGVGVAPVPSPLVAATGSGTHAGRALVCLASKRGVCHATLFGEGFGDGFGGSDGATWLERRDVLGLIDAERFEAVEVDRVIADGHLPEAMRASAEARGIVIEPVRLSAVVLARLALGEGLAGPIAAVDPALVRADYAREPEAVRVWRERRG